MLQHQEFLHSHALSDAELPTKPRRVPWPPASTQAATSRAAMLPSCRHHFGVSMPRRQSTPSLVACVGNGLLRSTGRQAAAKDSHVL